MPATTINDSRRRDYAFPVALFANSAFGGMTIIGIPVSLNAAGVDKVTIAVFYTVNALIAVGYNTRLMPRLRKANYPKSALIVTSALIPAGYATSILGAGNLFVLFLGGAGMMFVSTLVPQILGRKQAEEPDIEPERAVGNLRRILILGYVVGLGAYSLVTEFGLPVVASSAATGFICTLALILRKPRSAEGREHQGADRSKPVGWRQLNRVTLAIIICALCSVAFLKGASTFRGIYVPLVSTEMDISPSVISTSTLVASLAELLILPVLTWMSLRWGSPLTLGIIALSGVASFYAFFTMNDVVDLFVAQFLFAIMSVGFQSTGIVLLSKLIPGGLGPGASAYMAVMQVGSISGALLPVFIEGYEPTIFIVGIALCAISALLAVAVYLIGGKDPRPVETSS